MQTTPPPSKSLNRLSLITFIVLLVSSLLSFPITNSLWLDECITTWVTAGEFSTTTNRALGHQGQSPLYFWIVWFVRQLADTTEALLRIPSLLFALLGGLTLWAVASRHISKQAALFTLIFWGASTPFLKIAINARPYALAVLGVLLATASLFRYLEASRQHKNIGWLMSYGLALLFTFYAHYLFGAVVLVHWGILILYRDILTKQALFSLVLTYAVLVVLVLPGFSHLLTLAENREHLLNHELPTVRTLLKTIFPPRITVAIVTSLTAALLFVPSKFVNREPHQYRLVKALLLWWLLPPLLFFFLSHLLGNSLFSNRYILWGTPAFALLLAFLIEQVISHRTKIVIVILFAILLLTIPRKWQTEDWRGALQVVDQELADSPRTPVLLYSGLNELENSSWLTNSRYQDYLSAPVHTYPIKTKPIVIPMHFSDAKAQQYFKTEIHPLILSKQDILLISQSRETIHHGLKQSTPAIFLRRFEKYGATVIPLFETGRVRVYRLAFGAKS